MYKASITKHTLKFKQPSGTSRGVLHDKDSWILKLWENSNPHKIGLGEASIIKTLSPDWGDEYEDKLKEVVAHIDEIIENDLQTLNEFPSIYFAVEMALIDLKNGGKQVLFPSSFTQGIESIPINGLIWMGDEKFMHEQIEDKITAGFTCIKMKIGAIDFEKEIKLLQSIRKRFNPAEIELRVDANGAFSPTDALAKLKELSGLDLHSIEQPIKQGQISEMKKLCATTPLPIALDEELIGVNDIADKEDLLTQIRPQYIILKPSLIGGFKGSDEWIELAEKLNIRWWITSALESNIGLNAIAQYTFTKNNTLPQGLGTGQLYTNNFDSPLQINSGRLVYLTTN
jgi:o-succinylbenzoate synthase